MGLGGPSQADLVFQYEIIRELLWFPAQRQKKTIIITGNICYKKVSNKYACIITYIGIYKYILQNALTKDMSLYYYAAYYSNKAVVKE